MDLDSENSIRKNPFQQICVYVLLIVGVALRISYQSMPVMYDEAFSYTAYASKGLITALWTYNLPNNHFLNTFFMYLSRWILGESLWAMRLPALLFSILLLPLTYRFWTKMANRDVATIALGLTVFSAPLLRYSAEARGYSIQAFFFLLSFYIGLYWLPASRPFTRKFTWMMSASLALALYTIPSLVFGAGSLFLWIYFEILGERDYVLRKFKKRELVFCVLFTGIITAILYTLPFLYVIFKGRPELDPAIHFWSWKEMYSNFKEVFLYWVDPAPWAYLALGISFIIGIVFWPGLKKSPHSVGKLMLALLIWPMLLGAIMRFLPPFPRVWTYLIPFISGLFALGLWSLVQGLGQRLAIDASKAYYLLAFVTLGYIGWEAVLLGQIMAHNPCDSQKLASYYHENMRPGDILGIQGNQLGRIHYHTMTKHYKNHVSADHALLKGDWDLNVLQLEAPIESAPVSTVPFSGKHRVFLSAFKDADIIEMRNWLNKYIPKGRTLQDKILERFENVAVPYCRILELELGPEE